VYNKSMKLFSHQSTGISDFTSSGGRGAFFWDVGCGKTLAALKSFEELKKDDPTLRLFVVCPVSLIESAWGEDIKKFTKLTYSNLRTSADLSADILIVNFETLISKRFAPVIKRIVAITEHNQFMGVIDESQRIKSYNAKTTRYLLALSPLFKYRLILSATPAPNSMLEYWSQMEFLRPKLLGNNFFSFRSSFFGLRRGKDVIPLGGLGRKEMMMLMKRGWKMDVMPGAQQRISDRMAPYCQFVEKRDVLDLPDEIDVIRPIEMTKPQTKAFKEMQRDLVTEIENEQIDVVNALSKLMKLRQISSGFAYNREGKAIEFKDNPKMKELENVIEDIGRTKSVVIFCQYRFEVEKICNLFGERARSLYSKTKDKEANIKEFKNTSGLLLVAHPLSAGVGLSFNDCDYMIFYSLDYSYMNYYQCRGRIMRAQKKNNATYIHLIAEGSLDRIIMQALKNKHDNVKLFQNILKQCRK